MESISVIQNESQVTNVNDFTIQLNNVTNNYLCKFDNKVLASVMDIYAKSNQTLKIKFEMFMGEENGKIQLTDFEGKDQVAKKSTTLHGSPRMIFETGSLHHGCYIFKAANDRWHNHSHMFFKLTL